jgi:hypothetical protein
MDERDYKAINKQAQGLSAEEMIWKIKFPQEVFNADDFYDWASENSNEAFNLCLDVARSLSNNQKP